MRPHPQPPRRLPEGRQPTIDYGTLRNQAYVLAKCFCADIESHHPGIDALRLPPEGADALEAEPADEEPDHAGHR